ncbi:MAG: hypothetical protein AB7E30_05415 [Lawsonibacter sp.]
MNWEFEAVDKLKGYEAHRRALENIPMEIKRLEDAFVSIRSATTDATPVSGGGSTREDVMLSNIAHREELARTLKQALAWVRFVDAGLSALGEEEHLVLERFYIHRTRGSVDRLCEELGILNPSGVYKRKDKALRHFTIALYGMTEI